MACLSLAALIDNSGPSEAEISAPTDTQNPEEPRVVRRPIDEVARHHTPSPRGPDFEFLGWHTIESLYRLPSTSFSTGADFLPRLVAGRAKLLASKVYPFDEQA